MKKVLIIGLPFQRRQRGSTRLTGLVKYLPEFGWQPIILTATIDDKPDQEYSIIETPYRDTLAFWKRIFRFSPDEDIRRQAKQRFGVTAQTSMLDRLLTLTGEIVNYPDSEKGWKPFAVKAGDEVIRQEGIDVIISTSAPVTAHIVARELKIRHRIPWLADLRDPWSQNHNYSYSRVRRWFDRRLELKTLALADALITVSQPWADNLRTLHRGKLVFSITNGFDPAELNIPQAELTRKFTITYTGTIHPDKQHTSKLFIALRDLISNEAIDAQEVEVRFYRPVEGWLAAEAGKYGLSGIVNQYGQVQRRVAVEKQRESQVLLVLNWEGEEALASHPGKLFEYLAAMRPILATGGLGNYLTEGILNETKAGLYAPTIEDVKNSVMELYREYKYKGRVDYKGDVVRLYKYSHREMAKRFSEILNGLPNRE